MTLVSSAVISEVFDLVYLSLDREAALSTDFFESVVFGEVEVTKGDTLNASLFMLILCFCYLYIHTKISIQKMICFYLESNSSILIQFI